jgi:acetyl esterase/lipase
MRAAGETPFPKFRFLASAEDFAVPSREAGRTIPCRVLRPQTGTVKAVFLHIHGGGWVLQDEKSQDPTLQDIANSTGCLVLSVGYRLAPEHPFPAGPDDCYDVAEWLVENAAPTFGAPLAFVGGESAGGHLSMLVALHLLQTPKYADFRFRGLLLHYGCYSMVWTPRVYNFHKPGPLILDRDLMDHFAEAFLPGMTEEEKKHPSVSPLYADLEALRGRLPPALFTCGTEDCLLDDTLFMSTKWLVAGGEAVVKIMPGAPHGYIMFPREVKGSRADEGLNAVEEFVRSKLA